MSPTLNSVWASATPTARGVTKDDGGGGVKWFRKAAEQNYARAQYNLGVRYTKGQGVAKDDAEAVKWFRKAAEQNDAWAQAALGVRYAKGQGVAKNKAEAVKWYRKAAEQNVADAQYNLGVCYANGQGVTEDDAEAVKWFRKAAEQISPTLNTIWPSATTVAKAWRRIEVEAYKWWLLAGGPG